MERLRIFRKKSRVPVDVTHTFFTGKCHMCMQKNAKVGHLNCKKHNYCQSCAEFVPRFIKGDFTCKICAEDKKTHVHSTQMKANIYKVLDEVNQHSSTPTVVHNDRHISQQHAIDNSGLDGNNEELEILLASLTQDSQPTLNTDTLAPIPRKRSFMHLALPSSSPDATEHSDTSESHVDHLLFNNYVSGYIERARDVQPFYQTPAREPSTSPPLICDEMLLLPKYNQQRCHTTTKTKGGFQPDPNEVERGTSPFKGIRPRSVNSSNSETEQIREMLGDIDGPDMTSSSSSRSGSSISSARNRSSSDEFW